MAFEGPCAECGGRVVPRTGPGRTMLYKLGDRRPVPEDMVIPTCNGCNETYVPPELEAALEQAFRRESCTKCGEHCAMTIQEVYGVDAQPSKVPVFTCEKCGNAFIDVAVAESYFELTDSLSEPRE